MMKFLTLARSGKLAIIPYIAASPSETFSGWFRTSEICEKNKKQK